MPSPHLVPGLKKKEKIRLISLIRLIEEVEKGGERTTKKWKKTI
jgi:hypothetical protein